MDVLQLLALLLLSTNIQLICGKKKPNIIYILGDDIGYDDIGFQSGTIHTPTLDALRRDGQFLKWHYAEPVCTPTRASLLTGLYPLHNGINTVLVTSDTYGLSLNFTLLPEVLLQHGYDTHMLGFYKWAYTPTFRGFKSWLGYYTGALDYYTHRNGGCYDFHNDIGLNCGVNCSQIPTELYQKYSTEVFTDRAIEIIKNHSIYEQDKPLFLYLAYQTGHYPDACPSKYIQMNNDTITDPQRRLYAGMLTCMDDGIKNITDTLQKYGYLDDDGGNTIIIFASDNGAPVPMGNVTNDGSNGGYNWPLRGGKDSIWEGGTRVTGIVWGTKDVIPENVRGGEYKQLMHISDWYPTLLAAAGLDENSLNLNYSFDGINHWNGIIGNYNKSDEYFAFRQNLYYGYDVQPLFGNIAFRNKWLKVLNGSGGNPRGWYKPPELKLLNDNEEHESGALNNPDQPYPLYNLQTDPNEYDDIANNNTNIVQQLLDQMIQIKKTGVPQSVDEQGCPEQVTPIYPVVGKVWWPWCG